MVYKLVIVDWKTNFKKLCRKKPTGLLHQPNISILVHLKALTPCYIVRKIPKQKANPENFLETKGKVTTKKLATLFCS
jgi:hypothetical protein